jgi:hypothetical protein
VSAARRAVRSRHIRYEPYADCDRCEFYLGDGTSEQVRRAVRKHVAVNVIMRPNGKPYRPVKVIAYGVYDADECPGWWRDGFEGGRRAWVNDAEHGRAGVWFRQIAEAPTAVTGDHLWT